MVGRADRGRKRLSDPFLFDRGFWRPSAAAPRRCVWPERTRPGVAVSPVHWWQPPWSWTTRAEETFLPAGLTDSKLLSPASRERIYREILCSAKSVCWTAISAGTVDRIGLHRCNLMALCQVLESCSGKYAFALVDGFDLKRPDLRASGLVRGDYKSAAVAAASVVAKVVRDRLMRRIASLSRIRISKPM